MPSALRQVTDLLMGSGETYTLWDPIHGLLTSHEKERYELLRQIWTNRGRGRAWLRSAINERSLERYMTTLIASPVLKNFYEDWAFILDPELSSILPTSAAGLSSILFALSIDRPELNQATNCEDFSKSAISDSETVIEEPEPGRKKEDTKKSKKLAKTIISFGDEETPDTATSRSGSDNHRIPVITSVVQVDGEDHSGEVECAIEATGALDLDLSNSDNEFKNENDSLAPNPTSGLRLLSNSVLGDLIPVSTCDENQSSEDSISVPSVSEEGETSSTGPTVEQISESAVSESNESDASDRRALLDKLEKAQETNSVLSSQVIQTNMASKMAHSKLEQKIQELQKENDSLKESLRKYVSAVQLLKQDGTDFEGEELYQQKLVQVAEMHGELMELNDRLQRNMVSKDMIIKRLYLELEALRGPLGPTEIDVSTQIISLWVTSVFLSGSQRQHHVYQIHVRIGPEEWNVYRRYSEFYNLHQESKKQYPVVSAFQFPPKKTIGNKDSKFVEDRRIKLQQYLRRLGGKRVPIQVIALTTSQST
uniref:Sorting nexin-29 n=1 Tax=Lygus hesperus TaxID=30085 RepID=A0A0K8S6G7_LYGHE